MKIKMLVSMAGSLFSWNVGDVVEVDDGEGQRLIAAGFADATPEASQTALPADWRDLHHLPLIKLAKEFDASVSTKADAIAVLEKIEAGEDEAS